MAPRVCTLVLSSYRFVAMLVHVMPDVFFLCRLKNNRIII